MRETHRYWPLTTACGRFEHVVAFKLSLITAMLIALESKHFATSTWPLLLAALASRRSCWVLCTGCSASAMTDRKSVV